MAVYFGLPAVALWQAYTRTQVAGFLRWLVVPGVILAAATLLQVFLEDLRYLKEILPRISGDTRSSPS